MDNKQQSIIIYERENGELGIDVRVADETVWLSQAQIVELFHSSKANVSEHIKNIFEEGELGRDTVVREFRTTASDNKVLELRHLKNSLFYSISPSNKINFA